MTLRYSLACGSNSIEHLPPAVMPMKATGVRPRRAGAIWLGALLGALAVTYAHAAAEVPAYTHIFVIIAENKGYELIIGPATAAPNINHLALQYGLASQFFAEVHPSEGNYSPCWGAIPSASTTTTRSIASRACTTPGARSPSGPITSITPSGPEPMDQLQAQGLSWKAYMENMPEPGSLAVRWPNATQPVAGVPAEIYAVKHNGFMNFENVQHDPDRAEHIVDFNALYRDLASGQMPNYAHIVPNQCDDMHGRDGSGRAAGLPERKPAGIDRPRRSSIAELVQRIMDSPVWKRAAMSPSSSPSMKTIRMNGPGQTRAAAAMSREAPPIPAAGAFRRSL